MLRSGFLPECNISCRYAPFRFLAGMAQVYFTSLSSHNIVVETVLKTVMEVLDTKIAEVEQQINFAVFKKKRVHTPFFGRSSNLLLLTSFLPPSPSLPAGRQGGGVGGGASSSALFCPFTTKQ